jgi:hypothetical protein
MNFPSDFYQHLSDNSLTEIKGGTTRETFLEIWVVAVGGRVFARSWNKSPRSWFTAFISEGVGEIKFGEQVFKVTGKQLASDDPIHRAIDDRYLEIYDQPHNLMYSQGIAKPEYYGYTMEFFYKEDF